MLGGGDEGQEVAAQAMAPEQARGHSDAFLGDLGLGAGFVDLGGELVDPAGQWGQQPAAVHRRDRVVGGRQSGLCLGQGGIELGHLPEVQSAIGEPELLDRGVLGRAGRGLGQVGARRGDVLDRSGVLAEERHGPSGQRPRGGQAVVGVGEGVGRGVELLDGSGLLAVAGGIEAGLGGVDAGSHG